MEWTTYQLSDVCTIKKRGVTPKEGVCYALYSLPAFDKSKKPEIVYGQEIKSNKFSIQNNTILFNKLNVRFKRVWNIKELKHSNNICSTEFFPLSVKGDVEQDFLYYYLISDHITEILKKSLSGTSSSHQRIDLNLFLQLPINLPSISDQRKIAGILSALDSKIENNNKINANLEAQAEALFKSWFVDFTPFKDQPFVDSELGPIPQGWKVGTLGDIALQSTEKVLTRNDVKVLSPITTGKLVLSEEYFTKQVFSKSIRNYKIVKQGAFAYNPARVNIGSLGMNEFKFDGCVSPVYVVFECLKGYSFFFDLFRKTDFFKQAVISFAIGGVRQTLNYSDFALIDVTIPPQNIVQSFNEIYLHLKKKISINEEENQRLAALRDTLLPKLMSGEIKL